MLRLMGGFCVLSGSVAAGLRLTLRRRRGLEEWTELLDACRTMERELRCREPTLPELLDTLSRCTGGPVRRHFAACQQGLVHLDSRPFSAIWRESLSDSGLDLPRQDREQFRGLGDILGRYDRETQCAALTRLAEESAERLRRARERQPGRNRLYMTLSAAGGMLLVILAC